MMLKVSSLYNSLQKKLAIPVLVCIITFLPGVFEGIYGQAATGSPSASTTTTSGVTEGLGDSQKNMQTDADNHYGNEGKLDKEAEQTSPEEAARKKALEELAAIQGNLGDISQGKENNSTEPIDSYNANVRSSLAVPQTLGGLMPSVSQGGAGLQTYDPSPVSAASGTSPVQPGYAGGENPATSLSSTTPASTYSPYTDPTAGNYTEPSNPFYQSNNSPYNQPAISANDPYNNPALANPALTNPALNPYLRPVSIPSSGGTVAKPAQAIAQAPVSAGTPAVNSPEINNIPISPNVPTPVAQPDPRPALPAVEMQVPVQPHHGGGFIEDVTIRSPQTVSSRPADGVFYYSPQVIEQEKGYFDSTISPVFESSAQPAVPVAPVDSAVPQYQPEAPQGSVSASVGDHYYNLYNETTFEDVADTEAARIANADSLLTSGKNNQWNSLRDRIGVAKGSSANTLANSMEIDESAVKEYLLKLLGSFEGVDITKAMFEDSRGEIVTVYFITSNQPGYKNIMVYASNGRMLGIKFIDSDEHVTTLPVYTEENNTFYSVAETITAALDQKRQNIYGISHNQAAFEPMPQTNSGEPSVMASQESPAPQQPETTTTLNQPVSSPDSLLQPALSNPLSNAEVKAQGFVLPEQPSVPVPAMNNKGAGKLINDKVELKPVLPQNGPLLDNLLIPNNHAIWLF